MALFTIIYFENHLNLKTHFFQHCVKKTEMICTCGHHYLTLLLRNRPGLQAGQLS